MRLNCPRAKSEVIRAGGRASGRALPTGLLLALAALSWGAVWGLGQQAQTLISAGLLEPYGAAVDLRNYCYITDSANNRILRYTPETGAVTNFAGSASREAGVTDGKGVFARFYSPQGIVVVPARKGLIIADSGNHSLRLVSYEGEVTTVAGSTNGASGFLDGVGTAARFKAPAGLAADSEGNVYIADLQNHAVRKLALNNAVTTLGTGFLRPSAVAIGGDGRLYVADTGNHSIRALTDLSRPNQTAVLVAGSGSSVMFGYKDSVYATSALFDNPNSLLWVGGSIGLLVGDSGNHVLRRVFTNLLLKTNSVETYAPSVGIGLDNPVGLARDLTDGLMVVDLGNNNVRRISGVEPAQPAVQSPVIGYVELTKIDLFTGTRLYAVTNTTFNNDVVVAILGEPGTYTFFTFGSTTAAEGVPDPNPGSTQAPAYADNSPSLPPNLLDAADADVKRDVTIKAIGMHPARQPSGVVSARFRFQVADPAIYGLNPAAFTMGTATTNAALWYTTDGQDPEQGGPTAKLYAKGERLDILQGTNDVVFKVRGFRPAYHPSAIVQRTVVGQAFVLTNLEVTALGFMRDFTGAPGATLILPVELRLAGDDALRSLQFRVEVQTNGTAPAPAGLSLVAPSARDFIPLTTPLGAPTHLIRYANGAGAGLGLAYLPAQQDFVIDETGPIVLLSLTIPTNAVEGQSYTLAALEPSGTPENQQGSLQLTPLANRTLWVSNVTYLVGDTAAAEWYNAGDFGDRLLSNNDVNDAFYASLGARVPFAFTDAFDAMDAFPLDTADRVGGDGQLRFLDWQITLERSLKLRPGGWRRTRGPGGARLPVPPSVGKAAQKRLAITTLAGAAEPLWRRQVKVTAGTLENAQPEDTVRVPIYVNLAAGANLAGLQLWPVVSTRPDALDSELPSRFEPNTLAGIPAPSQSSCPGYSTNNAAYVWDRGRFDPPLVGSNLLGWLSLRVPALAPDGQDYVVRFANADGAPVEDVQYDFETVPGAVWVNSPALRPPERIADEWKMSFFGSLAAASAQAGADPDNDGLSNLAEYLLNTNPTLPDWRVTARLDRTNVVVGWYGEKTRLYEVLRSADLNEWQSLSPALPGGDQMQEFTDPRPAPAARFYRVRMLP